MCNLSTDRQTSNGLDTAWHELDVCQPKFPSVAQRIEYRVYTAGVTGSNPVGRIINNRFAVPPVAGGDLISPFKEGSTPSRTTGFSRKGTIMDVIQRYDRIAAEMRETFVRKNHDYGNSVFQSPEMAPDIQPEEAVRVRISDKLGRLKTLLSGEQAQVSESIRDTYADLVNYLIILLMILDDRD